MKDFSNILEIGREIYRRGLTSGSGGNISIKLEDKIYITSSGAPLGFLSEKDIVEVNIDGSYSSGLKPSSELKLHLFLYQNLDINAIIHAHPPFCLAFFKNRKNIEFTGTEARYLLSYFKVVEDPGINISRIEDVCNALKACPITFIKNHGSVAVGKDLMEAFLLTDLLESEAKILILSHAYSCGFRNNV